MREVRAAPQPGRVRTGAGKATLPVATFIEQMIDEVSPTLVITVGTAGGTLDNAELGDVMITRAAQFRCAEEFRNEPFADRPSTRRRARSGRKHLATATELMQTHADQLQEPDFGPPTKFYDWPGPLIPGVVNTPSILVEARDFPKDLPMLTTDFFEFGTSTERPRHEGLRRRDGRRRVRPGRRRSSAPPAPEVARRSATPPTRRSTATSRSARRRPRHAGPLGGLVLRGVRLLDEREQRHRHVGDDRAVGRLA